MINVNKFIKSCLVLIILLLSSQMVSAQNNFKLDGYKNIKFGLSVDKLQKFGYKCTDYGTCRKKDNTNNTDTLFSQEARVSIYLEDNKVTSISVTVDLQDDEMIEAFTKSLGAPEIHNYVSYMGYKIKQYYWVSSNGTSISVAKNLDVKTRTNIFGNVVRINSSSANYKNKQGTKELIDTAKKAKVDNKDF